MRPLQNSRRLKRHDDDKKRTAFPTFGGSSRRQQQRSASNNNNNNRDDRFDSDNYTDNTTQRTFPSRARGEDGHDEDDTTRYSSPTSRGEDGSGDEISINNKSTTSNLSFQERVQHRARKQLKKLGRRPQFPSASILKKRKGSNHRDINNSAVVAATHTMTSSTNASSYNSHGSTSTVDVDFESIRRGVQSAGSMTQPSTLDTHPTVRSAPSQVHDHGTFEEEDEEDYLEHDEDDDHRDDHDDSASSEVSDTLTGPRVRSKGDSKTEKEGDYGDLEEENAREDDKDTKYRRHHHYGSQRTSHRTMMTTKSAVNSGWNSRRSIASSAEKPKSNAIGEGHKQDEKDPCIMSVEPDSLADSDMRFNADTDMRLTVSKSKTFIISEPQGSIVDKFVGDDCQGKNDKVLNLAAALEAKISNTTSANKSANKDDRTSCISGKSSASEIQKKRAREDRLACNFSVEPLSPMSEFSESNDNPLLESKPSGIMTLLERYLPDDVSDGPINAVLDAYIPTFASDTLEEGTTFEENASSGGMNSTSTTSHPLRFVNELALSNSGEGRARDVGSESTQLPSFVKEKQLQTHRREAEVDFHRGHSDLTSKASGINERGHAITEGIAAMESNSCGSALLSEGTTQRGDDSSDNLLALLPAKSLRYDGDSPSNYGEGLQLQEEEETSDSNDNDEDCDQTGTGNVSKTRRISIADTEVRVFSPKYRGWKPEELEVILLEAERHNSIGKLEALPTIDTDVCSSHSSYVRELDTLQREWPGNNDDQSSRTASSIPPLSASLSYDSEDPAALQRSETVVQNDLEYANPVNYRPENAHGGQAQNKLALNTRPLVARTLAVNVEAPTFTFNTPSSNLHVPNLNTKSRQPVKSSTKQTAFRQNAHSQSDDLLIRATRSEELPIDHQGRSYLDTIVEQIDPIPLDVSTDSNSIHSKADNKENSTSTSTDFWQSSMDSLRQLKATHRSQRQLLTRLIAERNGANATASSVKSKLTQWSETHRSAISNKDHEIGGLRRANQMLRIQVAQVKAAKDPASDLSCHRDMTELNRKLQELETNGVVVPSNNEETDEISHNAARLYRAERMTSSEFVKIDGCMFELKTKEVTTLQVCNTKNATPKKEERDDAQTTTDHQIQTAISKIVEKETAFLRQRVETLEVELVDEKLKSHNASQMSRRDTYKEEAGAESESDNADTDEKDTAAAELKDGSKRWDALSKRLERTKKEAKKASADRDRLKKELKHSRSISQEYRDKLNSMEKQMSSLRQASARSAVHMEKSLAYYQQKVRVLEDDPELGQPDVLRNEIASLRDLVETLQRDYAEAERRRVQTASECEALELHLKRTKQDLKSRTLDSEDLLKKTEELFAEKAECDEKILLLESDPLGRQYEHAAKKVRDLEERLLMLQEEVLNLAKERNDAVAERKAISSDLENVTLNLDQAVRDKQKLFNEVQQLQVANEDYDCRLEKLRLELNNALDVKKKCLWSKEEIMEQHKLQMAQLKDTLKDLELQKWDSEEKEQMVSSQKDHIVKLEKELEQEKVSARETEQDLAVLKGKMTNLEEDIARVEKERDVVALSHRGLSLDLERTKRDLESRILDNTELSLRIEQLYFSKEECEEKIAAMEARTADRVLANLLEPALEKNQTEDLLMAKMRIATLESEVEEFRDLAKIEQEKDFKDSTSRESHSDDFYTVNRERQEALAKCTFLSRENEKLTDILDITRTDLSRTIIEVSRLEMDLDDAMNDREIVRSNTPCEDCKMALKAQKSLSEQNASFSEKLEQAHLENQELQAKLERLCKVQTTSTKQDIVLREIRSRAMSEKADLLQHLKLLQNESIEKAAAILNLEQENASFHEKDATLSETVSALEKEKKELVERVTVLEEATTKHDVSSPSSSSTTSEVKALTEEIKRLETSLADAEEKSSHQQALLDEIKRLEELQVTLKSKIKHQQALMDEIDRLKALQSSSEANISRQQIALGAAHAEVSQLKCILMRKEAQERLSYQNIQTDAQVRRRISDLELKLQTAENSYNAAMQKYRREAEERQCLSSELQRSKSKTTSAEKEATHLKLQLSEMEEKLTTTERELEIKQVEIANLSQQISSSKTRDRTFTKEGAYKTCVDCDDEEDCNSAEDRSLESVECALVSSQQKRDRRELLELRNLIKALQNDIAAAEEERKKIEDEKGALLVKYEQASSALEEHKAEIKGLDEREKCSNSYNEAANTPELSNQDKQTLAVQLETTLAALDEKKERIAHLEQELQRAFSGQEGFADTLAFLQESIKSFKSEAEDKVQETNDVNEEDEKTCRINHLEDCLERVECDRQRYIDEVNKLRQQLSTTSFQIGNNGISNSNYLQAHIDDGLAHPIRSLIDDADDASSCLGIGPSMSDMSVASRTVMSVNSSVSLSKITQKHSVFSQGLNAQLGKSKEREDEVVRTVLRKVSLLQKEILKLNGSLPASSLDERSALNGGIHSTPSGDSQTLEFELECRLADVAQLAAMLELLIVDKKKSEQKIKALYEVNKNYLKEVQSSMSEKDNHLQQQSNVIDTLREELRVLKVREKVETRTLISEISLLEENISHLQDQYASADKLQAQAENRLETALREHKSLEVARKQTRSEREHLEKRLPKLQPCILSFQGAMEQRIAKLKKSELCADHTNQQLLSSAEKLKNAVEDILSYTNTEKRKKLRLETIHSSSSDTGEAEYFVTLNDYEFQLYVEQSNLHAATKEDKQAIIAEATTQKKFQC